MVYVFWYNLVVCGLYIFWYNLVGTGAYIFWYSLVDCGFTYYGIIWLIVNLRILT